MADYTPANLRSELQSDPAGLGYAALIAAGNDAAIMAAINSPTGPGAASIPLTSIPRDSFMTSLLPAYLTLASKDAATQAKWDRILGVLNNSTIIAPNPGLFAIAIADGLLSQAQADACWHRVGSRAESLWGAGLAVSLSDISFALRGDR